MILVQRSRAAAGLLATALLLCASTAHVAQAQPVDLPIPAAKTDQYPPGVRVAKTAQGEVYVDSRGRVLYGMDMRTLLRAGPDPARYCQDACVQTWEPLLAPEKAAPNIRFPVSIREATPSKDGFFNQTNAPDWTVIAGPQGLQWVYKGWHVVFTRRGDRVGSVAHDGDENRIWNTLKFVPPVPKVVAPNNVKPAFVDGRYVLTTDDGRLLFSGDCAAGCADWQPLPAGMASAPLGPWAAKVDGDTPQWTYRGKPVFVSRSEGKGGIPPSGKLLQP